MQKLVSLFFSNINSYFPLLNSLIFEKQVFEEKLHLSNQAFAATLLAVCALGSRHCNDPRTLYDGNPSEERSAGWKYFQQIPLTRAKLIQPASLFEIQLYVVGTWHCSWTDLRLTLWMSACIFVFGTNCFWWCNLLPRWYGDTVFTRGRSPYKTTTRQNSPREGWTWTMEACILGPGRFGSFPKWI